MKIHFPGATFIPSLFIVALLGLLATNVMAINLMFLSKEAPARNFSDEDWQYLNRAIAHSLAQVQDGTSYRWDNPNSPAAGLIEMLGTSKQDGAPCRRLRLTNHYNELKGVTEFVFCQQPDGEWKVVR